MHARMIAIAVTEPRIPNDAPRSAVRSSALISCATNSLLGLLGSLPASDSRPKQDTRKGFGYPAFEDAEQWGCGAGCPDVACGQIAISRYGLRTHVGAATCP